MKKLSPYFEKFFSELLGSQYTLLKESVLKGYQRTIRVNTLKIKTEDFKERFKKKEILLKPVPWYQDAFFVESKKSLGKTLEHFLGYFFMQDASSLIPAIVLDPKPGEMVLDLCSAPGGKTTQMAQMMKNDGLIFANEPKIKRAFILKANLQRCGVMNTLITTYDARLFPKTGLLFDKILADVPCSGTGTVISDPAISFSFNDGLVKKLVHLQKTILKSALSCLKKGGTVVFSTCSLDPRENEMVIDWAIKELGVDIEPVKINGLNAHPGLTKYKDFRFSPKVEHCLRIYPFDYQTEGFFVCKLRF